MTNSERVKVSKILSSERRIVAALDTVKCAIKYSVLGSLGYKFFEMFIVGLTSDPKSIDSLARFCREFHAIDVVSIVFGVLGCTWGGVEHVARKFASSKADQLRSVLESADKVK